jgi:site-specific recombinase XerD
MDASCSSRAAVDAFIQHLAQSERSPLTLKNYRCDLEAFARWFGQTTGDTLEPAHLTPTDFRLYKQWLLTQQRLKPASVNRKLATLHSFVSWASEVRRMPLDVGALRRAARRVQQEPLGPRWLTRREQHALVRALERGRNRRDLAIVQLLLHTGLRVRELCTLTWRDITLSARKGRLTVRHGKGGTYRQVPLNATARAAVHTLGSQQHVGTDAPLLLGQRGPLTPRGVQTLLAKYETQAHLDVLSPHVLRHSFCKNLMNAGVGLEQVATLAGHTSLETTRRYCTPSLQELEQAVTRLSDCE